MGNNYGDLADGLANDVRDHGMKALFHNLVHKFNVNKSFKMSDNDIWDNVAFSAISVLMRLAFNIYDANNNEMCHSFFNFVVSDFLRHVASNSVISANGEDSIELEEKDFFGSRDALSKLCFFTPSDEDLLTSMQREMYRVVMDKNGHPRCAVTILRHPDPKRVSGALISFMGTNFNAADWPINLNGYSTGKCKAKGNNGEMYDLDVHAGFKVMFDHLWEQKNGIKTLLCVHFGKTWNNVEVYVTGHSMGGALAQLCAVELGSHCFSVIAFSFGAPGIFTKRTTEKPGHPFVLPYRTLVVNWIHPYDPVPMLARSVGYSHIGYVFTLNETEVSKPWIGYALQYHKRKGYYSSMGMKDDIPTTPEAKNAHFNYMFSFKAEQNSIKDYITVAAPPPNLAVVEEEAMPNVHDAEADV